MHLNVQPYLETLLGGGTLSPAEVEEAFDKILAGADPVQVRHTFQKIRCLDIRCLRCVVAASTRRVSPAVCAQVGGLLYLLRARGETAGEIAGMVRAMTKVQRSVHVSGRLLDIVGTGGDGAHTINISTAALVLAAACGCKAAKIGNRSVSSMCGASPRCPRAPCGAWGPYLCACVCA